MARKWYAAHRVYGVRALNTNGARADRLAIFGSKADRNRWISESPDYREAITRQQAMSEWPHLVEPRED
jgi:hypothetical protein